MSDTTPKTEPETRDAKPEQRAAEAYRSTLLARERRHEPLPFLLSPEFKRLAMILLLAAGVVAVVLQMQWDKARIRREIEADRAAWEERQKALTAPPEAGVGEVGETVRWDNMLSEEKDDTSLDDVISDRGFKAVVRHLASMKEGEVLKPDGRFEYVDLLKNPAKHRGKVVSLSGLVNKVYSNIRLESNQGPYDCVYRLYLVDLSGTEGAVVDVLVRPDGINEKQPVETDAVFIRTHKYENKDGRSVRVPYLIARQVQKIQRQGRETIWDMKTTVIVVAVMSVLAGLILLSGRSRLPGKKPETNASSA